jgi:FtsH-binding integral membrane protein
MEAAATPAIATPAINRFLAQVYLVMTLGMVITALVAGRIAENLPLLIRVATNPWLAWGLFIIQILVVVVLTARVMTFSTAVSMLLFLAYAALTGVTLSTMFLLYSQEQITSVFWFSAGMFLLVALYGLLTGRDLSGAGSFLFMALAGWLLIWIFSWFFPFSNFNWFLNFVGIAIFAGLTAHDNQRLKVMGAQVENHPARGGLVVVGALALYLDFINLFLLLLRASSRN